MEASETRGTRFEGPFKGILFYLGIKGGAPILLLVADVVFVPSVSRQSRI